MVREPHEGSLGDALGQIVGRAAVGAVTGAIVVLTLGLAAELVRRRSPAHRVLALLDLTVPIGVRTTIVSLLALLATMTGPRPAAADDGVRGWLGQVSTTSTTAAPVAPPSPTRAATPTSTTLPAPVRPSGPVVLIPPLVVEQPATTPTTAPPVTSPRATPPPSAALPVYVVQRGDCLWSIAARRLGPSPTATAIDAGWRRIYAANRTAIGNNPNLISPGLVLTLPPLDAQP